MCSQGQPVWLSCYSSRGLAYHLAPSAVVCVLTLNIPASFGYLKLTEWFQKYLPGHLCLFHRHNIGIFKWENTRTQRSPSMILRVSFIRPCPPSTFHPSVWRTRKLYLPPLWWTEAKQRTKISSVSKFTLSWHFYCIYNLKFD